jgi:hypothetical protein
MHAPGATFDRDAKQEQNPGKRGGAGWPPRLAWLVIRLATAIVEPATVRGSFLYPHSAVHSVISDPSPTAPCAAAPASANPVAAWAKLKLAAKAARQAIQPRPKGRSVRLAGEVVSGAREILGLLKGPFGHPRFDALVKRIGIPDSAG